MRKLLKKSMAAVLTASMAMSMTACAGKAVKPGSEESEAKTSEAAAANVETSEVAGEEGLTYHRGHNPYYQLVGRRKPS